MINMQVLVKRKVLAFKVESYVLLELEGKEKNA